VTFLTADVYVELVRLLDDRGYGGDRLWSQSVKPPETPEDFVREYVWVVLNSGMKNTIARKIMDRVWPVVSAGGSASTVFGHPGKAAGINRVWRDRKMLFGALHSKLADDPVGLPDWCQTLPWVGKITKFHLAKNLGADVAKPDRWLERLASCEGDTVDSLCSRLALETGDRVATVDLILWRACATGLLVVGETISLSQSI
jgi:hypothetical protein